MEQIGLLRLRLQTGTNPFSFLLFTKTGDVDNTSRSVETDSTLDSTSLERGVMRSHDQGHEYRMGK